MSHPVRQKLWLGDRPAGAPASAEPAGPDLPEALADRPAWLEPHGIGLPQLGVRPIAPYHFRSFRRPRHIGAAGSTSGFRSGRRALRAAAANRGASHCGGDRISDIGLQADGEIPSDPQRGTQIRRDRSRSPKSYRRKVDHDLCSTLRPRQPKTRSRSPGRQFPGVGRRYRSSPIQPMPAKKRPTALTRHQIMTIHGQGRSVP